MEEEKNYLMSLNYFFIRKFRFNISLLKCQPSVFDENKVSILRTVYFRLRKTIYIGVVTECLSKSAYCIESFKYIQYMHHTFIKLKVAIQ